MAQQVLPFVITDVFQALSSKYQPLVLWESLAFSQGETQKYFSFKC